MGLNYRPAKGQAHAETLRLRREKRVKDLVRPIGRQSYAAIADGKRFMRPAEVAPGPRSLWAIQAQDQYGRKSHAGQPRCEAG